MSEFGSSPRDRTRELREKPGAIGEPPVHRNPACRSISPRCAASPISPGSRCRRTKRSPGLQGELNAILSFVETLSEVDVEGIEPMTSVMPMRMATRDDVVNDGGIAVAVTANAPTAEDHFFTVPKVIE